LWDKVDNALLFPGHQSIAFCIGDVRRAPVRDGFDPVTVLAVETSCQCGEVILRRPEKTLRKSNADADHYRSGAIRELLEWQENMADRPVSRILSSAWALPPARRGDHSSRSRLAPGLQQPTRGS